MLPLMDTIPRRYPPFATWLLIFLNSMIFLFLVTLPIEYIEKIFYIFGVVPARFINLNSLSLTNISSVGLWPFFTHMFLHGSFGHLISNMWILLLFGDNVEDRMGHIRFLIFYLLCGFGAISVHFLTNLSSTIPTIGASGAIAGVMGAYFVLFPSSRIITLVPIFFIPYFVEIPAFIYLFVWFLSQLFYGTTSIAISQHAGGIAWWAHAGGFIFGIILYRFFLRRNYRRSFIDEFRPW